MHKTLQLLVTILIFASLTACKTLVSSPNWPDDVPDRQIFVDKYLSNRDIKSASSDEIEAHLVWIVRFYKGTVLYPNGWNRISERFLDSIESPKDSQEMSLRLKSLGISIANEWAQDNGIRRINSSNVSVWGSALRTSAERDDQINYVSKVEADVDALINGTLKSNEINYERYYQAEDFDDF